LNQNCGITKLNFDTTKFLANCLPTTTGNKINEEIKAATQSLLNQARVFQHFAWQIAVSIILVIGMNVGYIYLMSRQTELMCKISVVGMEITMIICIGYGAYSYSKNPKNIMALIGVCSGIFAFLVFNCMLYCFRE